MTIGADIREYQQTLSSEDRALCAALDAHIERVLPEAEGKIWHRHPVWFLDGNPIVGYHRLKTGLRVLFWSGQSFSTQGLAKSGTFQAAEFYPQDTDALAESPFDQWLLESRDIQWDYKNIVKKKRLEKATSF